MGPSVPGKCRIPGPLQALPALKDIFFLYTLPQEPVKTARARAPGVSSQCLPAGEPSGMLEHSRHFPKPLESSISDTAKPTSPPRGQVSTATSYPPPISPQMPPLTPPSQAQQGWCFGGERGHPQGVGTPHLPPSHTGGAGAAPAARSWPLTASWERSSPVTRSRCQAVPRGRTTDLCTLERPPEPPARGPDHPQQRGWGRSGLLVCPASPVSPLTP